MLFILVMHMVDEASRFHIAQVLRTGEYLDTHVLGNCNEEEPMTTYMHAWVRYVGHPRMLHVVEALLGGPVRRPRRNRGVYSVFPVSGGKTRLGPHNDGNPTVG